MGLKRDHHHRSGRSVSTDILNNRKGFEPIATSLPNMHQMQYARWSTNRPCRCSMSVMASRVAFNTAPETWSR